MKILSFFGSSRGISETFGQYSWNKRAFSGPLAELMAGISLASRVAVPKFSSQGAERKANSAALPVAEFF
jgi:hypothetical protein